MPVIIFAGIIGGVFTPTEAAVVAVAYALVVDRLVYREIGLAKLTDILARSVLMTEKDAVKLRGAGDPNWKLVATEAGQ